MTHYLNRKINQALQLASYKPIKRTIDYDQHIYYAEDLTILFNKKGKFLEVEVIYSEETSQKIKKDSALFSYNLEERTVIEVSPMRYFKINLILERFFGPDPIPGAAYY